MPSASFQCSRLMCAGISEPLLKLPGRREIETTAASGNRVTTISAINPACAAHTRQRCCPPVTMAISASSFQVAVHARQLDVDQGKDRHEYEDHGGDRRGQAEVLARVLEGDA